MSAINVVVFIDKIHLRSTIDYRLNYQPTMNMINYGYRIHFPIATLNSTNL